jgi:hypothetical protein
VELSSAGEAMIKAYPDGKKFIVQFNMDYCIDRYSYYKSALDALKSGKIQLLELSKCYGESLIIYWLQAWLITLAGYMNFEINESQSKKTAMFILEECYMLNLAEISLLFKKLMKGYYGQFFNKFNGQIIIRACREYRQERGKQLAKLPNGQIKLNP